MFIDFKPGTVVGVNPAHEAAAGWTGVVGGKREDGCIQIIAQLHEDFTVTPLTDWYVNRSTLSRPFTPYNQH